ncbi:MAG: hypothetical protein M3O46_03065 [Myxococcota bacterium]|nr:hypothetical protein [Myxococcota bacterium]
MITSCDPALFRFDETGAVVVSGVSWNPCGHMLVNFGGVGGIYCQVAGLHNYPTYMTEEGYQRYMTENHK